MSKKVLKICIDVWQNASRDKRELSTIQELGADTEVMAKGPISGVVEDVDGFRVTRMSARPLKRYAPRSVNRLVALFTWAAAVRRMAPDVITGENLGGLTIGYLSNFGRRNKAKLVYDSHEFEIGRSKSRNAFQTWLVTHLERFLIKHCAFSIMVNDTIADEVQRIHRLKGRPVVARNVPLYWELDQAETARVRAGLLQKLNLPENTFLMMFHGGLSPERGIENLLQAAALVPGIAVVLLGNGQDSYITFLHGLCGELGITERVLFHPVVPVEILRNYTGAVNVGISVNSGFHKSYYFALPNKFFENIQSLTPLIVSDFPEMGKITRDYGIGLAVDPDNLEEIIAAIQRMRNDRELYAVCKKNLKRAKEDFCWEKEKTALKEAYRRILE